MNEKKSELILNLNRRGENKTGNSETIALMVSIDLYTPDVRVADRLENSIKYIVSELRRENGESESKDDETDIATIARLLNQIDGLTEKLNNLALQSNEKEQKEEPQSEPRRKLRRAKGIKQTKKWSGRKLYSRGIRHNGEQDKRFGKKNRRVNSRNKKSGK